MSTGTKSTLVCSTMLAFVLVSGGLQPARAGMSDGNPTSIPISGEISQPELAVFDDIVTQYMLDEDISAGSVAIAREGVVVYRRSFGHQDQALTSPVPPTLMLRIASVTKPITAAALRRVMQKAGLDMSAKAFKHPDCPNNVDGVLAVEPLNCVDGVCDVPSLSDQGWCDVTVEQFIQHRSGWTVNAGKNVGAELYADGWVTDCPASAYDVIRWVLWDTREGPWDNDHHERNCDGPGEPPKCYSNMNYMVAGAIIESVIADHPEWGYTDYLDVVRKEVMQDLGVPPTEIDRAHQLRSDQHPREPYYESRYTNTPVVCHPPLTDEYPYAHYTFGSISAGGLIATPHAVAKFAQVYNLWGDDIGKEGTDETGHGGNLEGTSSLVRKLDFGSGHISFVVVFNAQGGICDPPAECQPHHAPGLADGFLQPAIVDFQSWPTNPAVDCNDNYTDDLAEIASGSLTDADLDGFPDECLCPLPSQQCGGSCGRTDCGGGNLQLRECKSGDHYFICDEGDTIHMYTCDCTGPNQAPGGNQLPFPGCTNPQSISYGCR